MQGGYRWGNWSIPTNFGFITTQWFVSLCFGTTIKSLYFVQMTGKGVAEDDISDPYGHFITKGKKYFQGLYLKLVCSRNPKIKQFSTLSARMSKHLMRFMATMLILMMILNWTLTFTKCWLEKQVAKIFLLFAVWNFKSCNTLWAIIR